MGQNKLCFYNWVNSFRAVVGDPLVDPHPGWHGEVIMLESTPDGGSGACAVRYWLRPQN